MAITKRTRQSVFFKSGSNVQKMVVASAFGDNARITLINGNNLYIPSGEGQFSAFRVANGFKTTSAPFTFQSTSKLGTFSKLITEGTMYSWQGFSSTVKAQILSVISSMATSHETYVLRVYPALAAKEQATIKNINNQDGYIVPEIRYRISQSGSSWYLYVEAMLMRYVWSASTGLWTDGGGGIIIADAIQRQSAGSQSAVKAETLITDFFNMLQYLDIYVSALSNFRYVEYPEIYEITNDNSKMGFFVRCKNFAPYVQLGYTDLTSGFYSFNTNPSWNASGTVDPDDPGHEDDPYDPVPPYDPPPGEPDPTDPTDPIPEPSLPSIDGVSVGIYKAYCPSSSQLESIAAKLWDPTAWDAIKQMFTNPMDSIFGLAIVPCSPRLGNSQDVYLGRYNTRVSVPVLSSDYVIVDCGSVQIPKFYGSYLDHDPYTSYSLHLPYVGEIELDADEITGKTIHIKYHCNVITGDLVALVMVNNRVCYSGMGNFIRQLPLSQTDYSSVIQTAVSAASTVLTTATSVRGALAQGVANAERDPIGATANASSRITNSVAHGVSSTLNEVASTKLSYKHSGKIGQGAGQLGVQTPYIIVKRPNLALPEGNADSQQSNQKAYTGYPCNKIRSFSSLHGFTQVEAVRLHIADATDSELAELYEMLKGGIIF